jgi:hypothetical protein
MGSYLCGLVVLVDGSARSVIASVVPVRQTRVRDAAERRSRTTQQNDAAEQPAEEL